ncbi:MAG: putative Fe-S cluster assembly protein SufT [Acidimicrobiales bacterium]
MSADRHQPITLGRDCAVVLIPSGRAATLRQGDQVMLVQTLGTSITVQSDQGSLARIGPGDADALGLDIHHIDQTRGDQALAERDTFDHGAVIDQLRSVFDPEIPVNVVDLGLVYACEATPLAGGGHRVEIKMSMTAPGCGMGDVLAEDARAQVQMVPGVTEVDVQLVWDPPWDMSRMSEAARLELGMW